MGRKKSTDNNTSKTTFKGRNVKYRIILLFNGKSKKVFLETKDRAHGIDDFSRYIRETRKVKIKRETISSNGIQPLHSELILVKSIFKKVDIPEEKIFEDRWKIIKREDYDIEETYSVYGQDKKLNVTEIIQLLKNTKTSHRELGVANNKVVIYNESYFDVIVAKCPQDAEKLAPYIYENGGKYKKFFYRGIYTGYDKRDIFDIIQEETNWTRAKINDKYTDNRKKS